MPYIFKTNLIAIRFFEGQRCLYYNLKFYTPLYLCDCNLKFYFMFHIKTCTRIY